MTDKVANRSWHQGLSYGMKHEDFVLDTATFHQFGTLDPMELMTELTSSEYVRHDPDAAHRTLGMALAMFYKLLRDPTHDADENDLFAAALHTAMIWEGG